MSLDSIVPEIEAPASPRPPLAPGRGFLF